VQRLAWEVNYGLSAAIPASSSAPAIPVRMAKAGGRCIPIAIGNSLRCAAFRAFHSSQESIERLFFNLALITLCGFREGFILFLGK